MDLGQQSVAGSVVFSLSPESVRIGGKLQRVLKLASTSAQPQALAIDCAVHHVKANGSTSPKVFKGWKCVLGAHAGCRLQKSHSLKPVTTRVLYPGVHRIDIQVNDTCVASTAFTLLV